MPLAIGNSSDQAAILDSADDLTLIRDAIAGNTQAFEQLVYRYQDRLVHSLEHALGSRDDALEIAQQAFLLAWRKLDTFRGDAAFYSWLYRIARNVATSHNRRSRVPTASLDLITEDTGFAAITESAGSRPSDRLELEEQIEAVRAALKLLPEEFRQPLVLKELDGCSYEEISQILEIPLGTVRSRIFRARQELTTRLKRVLRDE